MEKLHHRFSGRGRSEAVRLPKHRRRKDRGLTWLLAFSRQRDVHRRPLERGLCPHPQREEEGQRSGPHGPGGRREGPRGHSGGRHGRHLRHHLPRRRQVRAVGAVSVTASGQRDWRSNGGHVWFQAHRRRRRQGLRHPHARHFLGSRHFSHQLRPVRGGGGDQHHPAGGEDEGVPQNTGARWAAGVAIEAGRGHVLNAVSTGHRHLHDPGRGHQENPQRRIRVLPLQPRALVRSGTRQPPRPPGQPPVWDRASANPPGKA